VYWRRRVLVLGLLVGLLGGGGWTGWAASTGRLPLHLSAAQAPPPAAEPSLAAVLPSLAGVRVPLVPSPAAPGTGPLPATGAVGDPAAATATPALRAPATTAAGPPCADDAITVALAAPRSATVGGSAALTVLIGNGSAVPCVRDLGGTEVEVVLLGAAGDRLWSSADCTPAAPAAPRLLAAGEQVDVDLAWDGRTSAAGCAGTRAVVPAGSYVLRARLGTRTAADVPLVLA
jgi:hypothetical protein